MKIEPIKIEEFAGKHWQDIARDVVAKVNEVVAEVNEPKIHVSPKFSVGFSGPEGQTTLDICNAHNCEYIDVSFDDGKTYQRFYPGKLPLVIGENIAWSK